MSELDPASSIRTLGSGPRIGRFLTVGALGAACDTAVLVALTSWLALPPELAKLVSSETAIVLMFLVNERWTFADEGSPGRGPFLRRLFTSNLVRVGGVVVGTVVFSAVVRLGPDVAVDLVGVSPLVALGRERWLVVANLAGIGAGAGVNYVLESTVTWRVTSVSE